MASADLLPVVEAVYDAATDPLKWPRALSKIANFFGDAGAIIEWEADDGRFGVVVSENLVDAGRDYAENGWSAHNFKGVIAQERGFYFNGIPFTDRHLCSDEEMQRQPFYANFLVKHGLGRFAGVSISPDPHIGVILSIQRSFDNKPAFSDEELAQIGIIGRHIEKSLRLSIRLLDAELVNLGLGDALTRVGISVFALDSLGRVVFSNPSAQNLPSDVFALSENHLQIRTSVAQRAFADAIARTTNESADKFDVKSKPILVESVQSRRRFTIYLLPIASKKFLPENILARTSVVVLAIEQKDHDPADPAAVRDVLGLTLGEARVASLIGSGLTTREAAARLGVGEETARTQLKSVFHKTGISRRSELVALLTKLMLS